MQFTTLFLAAAAASGLSLAQPTDMGSWDVIYEASWGSNGFAKATIWGNFTSPSYPGEKGIVSKCDKVKMPPNQEIIITCDNGFKAFYNGSVFELEQNIQLPNNQTVFGSGYIEVKTSTTGKSATGRAIIKVTSAIA